MNRSKTIERDFASEGSQRSQQLGLALAAECDPALLEALIHHIGAIQEFGGEFYVGAARQRFDRDGRPVEQGGSFETFAYVTAYSKKSRIKGQEVEPDEAYEQQLAPEAEVPETPVPIMVDDPEPAEVPA